MAPHSISCGLVCSHWACVDRLRVRSSITNCVRLWIFNSIKYYLLNAHLAHSRQDAISFRRFSETLNFNIFFMPCLAYVRRKNNKMLCEKTQTNTWTKFVVRMVIGCVCWFDWFVCEQQKTRYVAFGSLLTVNNCFQTLSMRGTCVRFL